VESADDILEELGYPVVPDAALQIDKPEHNESLLLRHLGHDVVSVDSLCQRSGLTVETVSAMLLSFELDGVVASLPGGCYQRIR
jgi:DNA processing protein